MKKWFLIAILPIHLLQATPFIPFTGPLIAPQPTVIPYGDFMVQSYVYFTANTGAYNENWNVVSTADNLYSLNPQILWFFGLTPWCDLNLVTQFSYNNTSHQQSVYFGDLTVALDFQLLSPDATPYFPGIKLAIREIFPTGNFQYFHPRKWLTESTGNGMFATQFNLVLYKLFQLWESQWLSATFSAEYTLNSSVNVHGFNTYGGGFGTNGQIYSGNRFRGIVSFELTLGSHWALALDNVYTHVDEAEFRGTSGISLNGPRAAVGKPSSEQLSFAPALEYRFSDHFGIIAGCWFSALGKNSAEFRSGVVNFQYTY